MTTYAFQQNGLERFVQNKPGLLAAGLRYMVLALRIRRERNQLAAMSDDQLKDLGISRAEANIETTRDLLDIPEHRKAGIYL